MHCFGQGIIIHGRTVVRWDHEFGQIDRSQVTGLHGKKGLFPAGVGALYLPDGRGRIVPVDSIQKDNAGITVVPCLSKSL